MLDFKPVDLKYIIRQIESENLFSWICQIHRETQLELIQLGNATPRVKHLIWAHLNFTEELTRLCKSDKVILKVNLVRPGACNIAFSSFQGFYWLFQSRNCFLLYSSLYITSPFCTSYGKNKDTTTTSPYCHESLKVRNYTIARSLCSYRGQNYTEALCSKRMIWRSTDIVPQTNLIGV